MVDSGRFLERIGWSGELAPTSAVLRALHRLHLLSVPFENLDIARHIPLSLHLPDLFDKIVTRRRGGFCYELNGLFAQVLRNLGFGVTCLSAASAHDDGSCGPDFDHLVLLVRCADDPPGAPGWLTDVGWGDSFRDPLLITPNHEQWQDGRAFWLEPVNDRLVLWRREADDARERQYAFTLQPHAFEDFGPMCLYHQTSPQSSFTRQRICTLALPDGRVTLRDLRLTVTHQGVRSVREITEAEFAPLLLKHFGIVW